MAIQSIFINPAPINTSGHPARGRGGLDGEPRVARPRGATDALPGLRPHLPRRARRRHRRKIDDNVHDIAGKRNFVYRDQQKRAVLLIRTMTG